MKLELSETSKLSTIPVLPIVAIEKDKLRLWWGEKRTRKKRPDISPPQLHRWAKRLLFLFSVAALKEKCYGFSPFNYTNLCTQLVVSLSLFSLAGMNWSQEELGIIPASNLANSLVTIMAAKVYKQSMQMFKISLFETFLWFFEVKKIKGWSVLLYFKRS